MLMLAYRLVYGDAVVASMFSRLAVKEILL